MKNIKKVVLGVGALVLVALSAFGLTETDLRTALAEWMKGNHTILNPWTEVVNLVKSRAVLQVDTFADLRNVSLTGVDEESNVETRGRVSAGDGAGAKYAYRANSSATTNLWSVSATSTGVGRWILSSPMFLRISANWDPAACATNKSVSTNFVYSLAEAGDTVMVSHYAIGSQDSVILSGVATNGAVRVVLYNNSNDVIDVDDNVLNVWLLKFP